MYVMREVFRENGLTPEAYVGKFMEEFKSGLTEIGIVYTHTKFDSVKTLSTVSVCQTLNLPLWIQKVVTGARIKGASSMSGSYLGRGECNEVLYFTVNDMNYFIGFAYHPSVGGNSPTSNQIFGEIGTDDSTPSYCQWHNYEAEYYQTNVSYGWFGIKNHYSTIILAKTENGFFMTFKSSKYGSNTAYQMVFGTARIINNSYTNTYRIFRGLVTRVDWDVNTVGSSVSLSSASSTFGKYYGLKGDLINGKFPLFETYIGVDGGGLVGKIVDLVTIPNINQEWGNLISVNGNFYVSTGGYYIRC